MDNIDILLRELNNHIGKEIYIAEESFGVTIKFSMIPVKVTYGHLGIGIEDKDSNVLVIDDNMFSLSIDDYNDCLEFSFRDKVNYRFIGICL